MNREELVESMATKAGVTKKDAAACLKAFMESVEDVLIKGDKLQLVGFGTFETGKRAAREGINPQTGKAVKIKATTSVKFKAGKSFKDKVNK